MEYDIETILEMYEDDYNPGPRPMAQGGRIGFYKGESVVKSHGQQIKELTEAGESSVSIAKKLKLKQQTVNNAINAMDKGIAGEKFKLSKPRSEIIKLAVNETGVNLKDRRQN
jgi:DNA-binding CsgD family transcriptional regulator